MIHRILRKFNMFYLDTVRKRTTDRFVIYREKGMYSYIKVDERKLEGISTRENLAYVYEKIIREQKGKNKTFFTLKQVKSHIEMI